MPGSAGPIAKAVETIFSWFTSEDGFKEMQKRRQVAAKKKECRAALDANDWPLFERLSGELRDMANKP